MSNGFSPESLLSGGLLKVLAADPYGWAFSSFTAPGVGRVKRVPSSRDGFGLSVDADDDPVATVCLFKTNSYDKPLAHVPSA